MTKAYKKPVVSIDTGMAEGVYAASGSALNVTYYGVWDRWGTVRVLQWQTGQVLTERSH